MAELPRTGATTVLEIGPLGVSVADAAERAGRGVDELSPQSLPEFAGTGAWRCLHLAITVHFHEVHQLETAGIRCPGRIPLEGRRASPPHR
jgi:hypothetical protein